MPASTLTRKGQTTIPKEVRDRLGLNPGDRIDFVIEPDGTVVLRPATIDVRTLRGLLRSPDRAPVPLEAMERAIEEAALRGRR